MDIRNISTVQEQDTALDTDTGLYYIDLDKPAGLAAGDFMYAVAVSALAVTPPAANGWISESHTVGGTVVTLSKKVALDADVTDTLRFAQPASAVGAVTVCWIAIRNGAAAAAGVASSVTVGTVTCPDYTPALAGITLRIFAGEGDGDFGLNATPSHGTVLVDLRSGNGETGEVPPLYPEMLIATEPATGGATGTSSLGVSSVAAHHIGLTVVVQALDPRPTTPVIVSPDSGQEFATNEDIPLALTAFASDIPGAVSASSTFQWKETGDSFTTVAGAAAGTATIPAGTITTPDTYLVQGLYTSDSGDSSPYSDLVTFTVVDPPATPTITAPTSGATVAAPTGTVTATAATHVAYEGRTVGDLAGDADPTVVYWAGALIVDSGAPSFTAHYPVNDVTVHTQVRIKNAAGHFSDWADVSNPVAWTKPDKPVITAITEIPSDAAITVDYTCAVDSIPSDATSIVLLASADDFATSFTAVTKTDDGDPLPVTAGTAPWHLPASGVDYSFKIRATNDYGATNDSDPDGSTTGTAGDLRTIIVDGGGP